MKPECAISSGYDPIKSEDTDDEAGDLCRKDTNTSKPLPINNIKEEEVVKAEVKTEEDVSTDDERSPECIVSSSGYDPVKSEETDDEVSIKEEYDEVKVKEEDDISTDDEQYSPEYVVSSSSIYDAVKSEETDNEELDDTTDRSNEHGHENLLSINIKAKVKTEDDSTDEGECGSERKEPERRRRSPRLLANSTQEDINIQCTKKRRRRCSKRKREVKESNESVQKPAYTECSVEGCSGKAADSGMCGAKHKGYNHCKHEGCTNKRAQGGLCTRHGAKRYTKKTCSHEGCTNQVQKGGVCHRHGAEVKTCIHEGCTNGRVKGGLCIRHGAVVKTCSHKGCTNQVKSKGFCVRHGAVKRKCSHEGCTNQVVSSGVCVKHGAVLKTCSHEGCTNQAQKGGICVKHGAKKKTCSHNGCIKHIQKGGFCKGHYKLLNGIRVRKLPQSSSRQSL